MSSNLHHVTNNNSYRSSAMMFVIVSFDLACTNARRLICVWYPSGGQNCEGTFRLLEILCTDGLNHTSLSEIKHKLTVTLRSLYRAL